MQLWYAVRQNLRTLEKIRLAAVDVSTRAETLRADLVGLKDRRETGSDDFRYKKRKLDEVCGDLAGKSKDELSAIESAQEKLSILIALRSSVDGGVAASRTGTPRKDSTATVMTGKAKSGVSAAGSSPATGTPTPLSRRTSTPIVPTTTTTTTITTSVASGGGSSSSRGRRESLAAQHPLVQGRKVAVLPTRTNEETDWLKATVLSFSKSTNSYTVQDDDDDGTDGTYKAGMDNILPLPTSLATMPASDYPPNTRVLAMYPDTSCFYGATVKSGGPGLTRNSNIAKLIKKEAELLDAKYALEFDDDNGEIRHVPAWLVVQPPAGA